jgi:tripartite-type tricarboxylate transporter receptor subunit TctC
MNARWITILLAGSIAGMTGAGADTWPTKPLRAIIPVGAGSITDIIPRIVLERLSAQIGQPIIVENRAGGATTVGTNAVAKAEPDGYTFLATSSAYAIAPSLNPNLGYDAAKDFAAVIPLGVMPSVMVVAPEKGFRSIADIVAAARARPGAMTFASAGVGTATHLSAVQLMSSAGVEALHVPFRGGPDILTEVMTGRVDFFMAPVGVALPHIHAGKLVALVVNSTERSSVLPDVPTTAEAGLKNAEYPIWVGMFLPAKTSRAIVATLHREALKALENPNVRGKLSALGVDPMIRTPEEFDAQVREEIVANAALIKAISLKVQ